jgi:N utilization substance protein A
MNNLALIKSFINFKKEKKIDQVNLMAIIEESIKIVLKKKYGSSNNYDIIVNPEQGDLEIWRNRVVVQDGEVLNNNTEISLKDSKRIAPDFEIGEEVSEKVSLDSLGRRSILSFKQNLISKISEYDNTNIYKKFKGKEHHIIHGEIYHVLPYNIIIKDNENNEMILPKSQQIPQESFRKGDAVFALIKQVEWKENKPVIILSRNHPKFLERLFEIEIPEISDKIIEIKNVARIPGEKSKIAVISHDDKIDPVGACVGMKGSRIQPIVKELKNENIDVINYTPNIELYITRALNPAKISTIEIDKIHKMANVFMNVKEISKAIGKNGQNIRLANQLTGYKINVMKDVKKK